MRIKRRIFSGCVLEQEIFTVPNQTRHLKTAEPRQRFRDEEERARHRIGIARRYHARKFNATFSPMSLYSTLTMDNENEVHTFEEARKVRDRYIRRLQYINPDAQIAVYMGRGKSTHRIHFHMVSNGLGSDVIRMKWNAGEVIRTENLREHNFYDGVDCGQDYSGIAGYLFDHWTPEQGGHYYRATKNLCKPDLKPPTEVKRNYSKAKPPRPPDGYKLVQYISNDFGYQYFKYVRNARLTPHSRN